MLIALSHAHRRSIREQLEEGRVDGLDASRYDDGGYAMRLVGVGVEVGRIGVLSRVCSVEVVGSADRSGMHRICGSLRSSIAVMGFGRIGSIAVLGRG